MRQENGIGYMKLIMIATVIVIVIIGGVIFAKKQIKSEQVKNIQADLLLIQGKVEVLKGKYNMDTQNQVLPGYKLTELPENINIQEFYNKNIIVVEEYEKYYLYDSQLLQQIGLGELVGKYGGYFIINYDNYEVIYTEGYENVYGVWCYKLSDLNKSM